MEILWNENFFTDLTPVWNWRKGYTGTFVNYGGVLVPHVKKKKNKSYVGLSGDNISYVGLSKSYVVLIISYVRHNSKSYGGLIISYVGDDLLSRGR